MKNIKKIIVALIISLASCLYKNVKYKNGESNVKVNLGCGLQCLPGWINIDGSLTALFGSKKNSWINKILYKLAGSSDYYSFAAYNKVIQENGLNFYNLQKGVPLNDNSTDIVYCSHFLEHLNKVDGHHFLEECFRALKPGGLLRVVVPDLDFAMTMYQEGKVEEMQGLFFYTSDNWDFTAHKHNYNFAYLQSILAKIGFTKIVKLSYRQGECPNIDYLDVYPEHSMYVECRKI
ncbi:MAG: methyltransferase domain-containing protein [Candidatus Falkowbacteria bacterium]